MPLPIAIIYVIAGVLFGAGAVYLQATRSLALSGLNKDMPALSIAYDKFKVQTFYPVVGLYIVALICAIGIPGYYVWQLDRIDENPINVSIPIEPRTALTLSVPSAQVDTTYSLPVHVYKSSWPIEYSIGNAKYGPVTLLLSYERERRDVQLVITSRGSRVTKHLSEIRDNAVSLSEPIVLPEAATPQLAVPSQLTSHSGKSFGAIPGPQGL